MIPATLVKIQQENKSTFTFWLRPDNSFDYTAGQFIELHLPHESDDRGVRRWFTLSSSPSEELLAVTTRKVSKMSSFKKQLFNLRPDDTVLLPQAMGDFVLPMQRSIPIICIARGIGITPIRSMTKYLADKEPGIRDITPIHSIRNKEDELFKTVYESVTRQVIPDVAPTQTAVRSAARHAKELYSAQPAARIYISGPEAFTESMYEELNQSGIKSSVIVTDYFHGYN